MSGKNRPRRNIKRGSTKDLSSHTDLRGKYYGQNIPIGKEQSDLYSDLTALGSGLPSTLGTGSSSSSGGGSPRSNTSPTAMGANLHGIYNDGSSYIDMLNGSYGNSELIQLLKSLGINFDKSLNKDQKNDWNKQLLDLILKNYADQEQRAYDRSVLEEQRLYDNPLNSLARLMGAGISRDAAIQMLSAGSGSGAGGSSGLIGSAATPISNGIPASQSRLNGVQADTAIANTVFGGINALSGLVGLGFSVPQAIQQTRYLQNTNALTERQLQAYDSTGRAYSILNAAGAAADAFGSVTSAAAAISKLAEDGNSDAAQFIANGGMKSMIENAPFASQTLSNLYRSERSSSDYAEQFTAQIANAWAENDLLKANKDNITKQVEVYEAEIENLHAQADYQEGLTNLLTWQQKLLGKQISYTEAQTKAQQMANRVEENWQNSTIGGKSAIDWWTDRRNNELYISVHSLIKQKDAKIWEKQVQTMLKNEDNLQALYDLSILYSNGTIKAISESDQDTQDLLYFCNACENCHLFEYVRTAADAEAAGHWTAGGSGTSMPYSGLEDIQSIIDRRGKPKKKGMFRK